MTGAATATVAPAAPAAPAPAAEPSSLYVGDLEPAVTEEALLAAFAPYGTVLSVRVCLDILTRRSLGYGYVNFQNRADAENALVALNYSTALNSSVPPPPGTPIDAVRPTGRPIRLMWLQRDPSQRYSGSGNVFIKNLPEAVDNKSLHERFSALGAVVSAKVMTDEQGKSRRYGFVHFRDAVSAKKAVEERNGTTWDGEKAKKAADEAAAALETLHVAYFIRRNARIAALVQSFTNVYIKHVLPKIDTKAIEGLFSKFGGITRAVAKQDPKGRTYGFCNFSTHQDAVTAIEKLHGTSVEGVTQPGETLFVQRAQHRSERLIELKQRHTQRQALGNNLYVRNLDPECTSEQLSELFKGYGEVKSARVMKDTDGNPRGFGFVSFANAEQANTALKELNGRMLHGKPLVVNVAQRRDHRTSMLQQQFQQRIYAMLHGGAGGVAGAMLAGLSPLGMMAGSYGPQRAIAPPQSAPGVVPFGGMVPTVAVGAAQGNVMPPAGRAPPTYHGGYGAPYGRGAPQDPATLGPVGSGRGGAPARRGGAWAGGRTAATTAAKGTAPAGARKAKPAKPVAAAAVPAAVPAEAEEEDVLQPITAEELQKMPIDEQRSALGERLYVRVQALTGEEHAPKITGMFLEMAPMDVLRLLQDEVALNTKVSEALGVLRAHGVRV